MPDCKGASKIYDWANLTGKFYDVNDYKQMCRSCHSIFDGRHPKPTKMTPAKVLRLWKLRGDKTHAELAKQFGISTALVAAIFYGRLWKHVTHPKR